jgi:hypothetical protein
MTLANVTVSSGNVTVTSVTDTGLTAGRVNYNGTGGLLVDSANLLFDGTTLTANNITSASATNLLLKSAGTTAVTIDTSQNVGIGTTSPSRILTIEKSGAAFPSTSNPTVRLNETSSGRFAVMELDSSTNFNIWNGDAGSGSIRFYRGSGSGTLSMSLDASGNLLVGSTSQIFSERLLAIGAGANVFTSYQNTNTSGYSSIRSFLQSNGNNTSTYHFLGGTSGVGAWYLYGNGTSSWSSDSRLKKNIETTRSGYLEDICKLRVVKYNWKNDAENTPKELGLIAQEVEQVFPGLVQDGIEPLSEDDPTLYKQLKGSVLPFMLLKAIQEQQAIITALTARLTALETL